MPNQTFRQLPQATPAPERLRSDLDRFGYCIMADVLSGAQIEAIRRRIDDQARAELEQGRTRLDAVQTRTNGNQWVYMLINKGEVFQDLLTQPLAREVVGHVLGPDYLLSDFAASITHPGNELMGLHIDQWWLPQPRPPDEDPHRAGSISRAKVVTGPPTPAERPINPPVVCNVMWMITDFSEENGATRLVPGSHLSGRHPDPAAEPETVSATGRAGSAVVFEGRTWHAAALNRSDAPRCGITTYYTAPQFRQMANYAYGTRKDVVAGLSPDLRRLLGFSPWHGYGATGDHGAEFIQPGEETTGELAPRG